MIPSLLPTPLPGFPILVNSKSQKWGFDPSGSPGASLLPPTGSRAASACLCVWAAGRAGCSGGYQAVSSTAACHCSLLVQHRVEVLSES